MKKILIVKPSSLGDVLHAFPAVYRIMENLQKEFPGEELAVDWVISPAFSQLLDFLPFPGEKILFDRKKLGKLTTFPGEFLSLFKALRKSRYDAVYDLQGLLRSAAISRLASGRVYYGNSSPKEKIATLFYTAKLDSGEKNSHAVHKLLHMVTQNKEEVEAVSRKGFTLPLHPEFRKSAIRKAAECGFSHLEELSGKKRLFAISPGARWESKEWNWEFFVDSCRELHRNFPESGFLILGSGQEKEKGSLIEKELLSGNIPCYNLCGKTSIGELVELIRLSSLLICNDSGPMHIAAFCDTPPIAMFGPTDPVLTGPWCCRKKVLQSSLACQPCFKRICPKNLECRKAVTTAQLLDAAKELLFQTGT